LERLARKSQVIESVLVVLAIASRAAAVFALQSHTVPRSTYEHGEIAANLLAGNGFAMRFLGADGPTSQQAPVYPAVVAVAFAAGGVGTPRALLLLELGQSVLGGLLVLGVLRLGRSVSPGVPSVAYLAALIVALHPTLVYAATHVQVASLSATILIWTLVWAYRTGVTGRPRDAAITGACLALLALTDPILALASLGIACAIRQGQSGRSYGGVHSIGLVAVVGAVALVGVYPWVVRNARVHGELVPIKSTFGYAFWQGNCSLSEGTDKVVRASVERVLDRHHDTLNLNGLNRALWAARHEAGYIDDIALTPADKRLLGQRSEPERSRILFRRAMEELRESPGRYARLCLRRLRYFIFFDETNPKSRVLAYRLSHLGLSVMAAIGLLAAGRALRTRLLPTILTTAALVVFHTLTIVSARFHIPLEPLLALWAAAGWSAVVRLKATKGSVAARDDVERVGIVNHLAVVHRGRSRFRLLPFAGLHAVEEQAGDECAGADHARAAPRDAVDRNRLIEGARVDGD
jgi:hypothetical protein